MQDLPQIAEVTSQDQIPAQNLMQIGIDDYEDPEILQQKLLDDNIPAAEKAFIRGRLINMNKPKTAGAGGRRNMGKKKLSTAPGLTGKMNQRMVSGSGVSSGMFFEGPGRQQQDSNQPTQQATVPDSALVSAHQPGETESHTKTGQGSQVPTLTRSYSLWKENFAIRKDMGYEKYQRLPKDDVRFLMQQLQSESNLYKEQHRKEHGRGHRGRAPDADADDRGHFPAEAGDREHDMDGSPASPQGYGEPEQQLGYRGEAPTEDRALSEDVCNNIDLRVPASIQRQESSDVLSFEARKPLLQSSRTQPLAHVHRSLDVQKRKRRNIPTFDSTYHSAF